MNDREKWRERVRDIRACGATWWWWWYIYIYIYIYIYNAYRRKLTVLLPCHHEFISTSYTPPFQMVYKFCREINKYIYIYKEKRIRKAEIDKWIYIYIYIYIQKKLRNPMKENLVNTTNPSLEIIEQNIFTFIFFFVGITDIRMNPKPSSVRPARSKQGCKL